MFSGVWIRRITQAVAQEVKRHDSGNDEQAGNQCPRVKRYVADVLSLADQHSPADGRGAKADAQERKGFASIMPGMESVSEAIRWLVNIGTMWRKITRRSEAPTTLAART